MEKSKKLVNILNIVSTVVYVFTIFMAAVLLIVFVGIQFVDIPDLNADLFSSTFMFDNSLRFDLSFVEGGNLRPLINRGLITGILGTGFLIGFMHIIRRILKNVKEDNVFIEQNSRFIKYLGYSMIGFSVVMSVLRFWIASAISDVITIPSAHFGANFSLDFQTIFIGLVIILLSQIFAYGTHLQNEYDATV